MNTSNPEKIIAKIADFGISRPVNSGSISQTRSVGTSNYMAPELLENPEIEAGEQLLRADVYAFGYILWTLCANQEPHKGNFNFFLEKQKTRYILQF